MKKHVACKKGTRLEIHMTAMIYILYKNYRAVGVKRLHGQCCIQKGSILTLAPRPLHFIMTVMIYMLKWLGGGYEAVKGPRLHIFTEGHHIRDI